MIRTELILFVTISTILLIRFAGSAGHDGQDHHGSAGHDYHGPTCHDYHGSAGQNYHGSASQNYHGAARQDHHGPTGQDHLAYLPSCVAKALPGFELARTSFQDLEFAQIWRDRITAGYLSCNFCVALVTKFQQNISKYDDIRALVYESSDHICNTFYWAYESCARLRDFCMENVIEDISRNIVVPFQLCRMLTFCHGNQTESIK